MTQIAVGSATSCALLQDSTVWCWGVGEDGRLGDGHTGTADGHKSNVALQVLAESGIHFSGAREIAAGVAIACAVDTIGRVLCWGRGGPGGYLRTGGASSSAYPAIVHSDASFNTEFLGASRRSYYCASNLSAGTTSCAYNPLLYRTVTEASSNTSPTVTLSGLGVGKTIRFYNGSDCSSTVLGSATSDGPVTLTLGSSVDEVFHIHHKIVAGTVESDCSQSFINYHLDTRPPAVSDILVSANTYRNNQDIDIRVTLDEKVLVDTQGGTVQLGLVIGDGSTPYSATYISGHDSRELLFRYTVSMDTPTDSDGIALADSGNLTGGGTIEDAQGNLLTSVGAKSLSDVLINTTPPTGPTITPPVPGYVAKPTLLFSEVAQGGSVQLFSDSNCQTSVSPVVEVTGSTDTPVKVTTLLTERVGEATYDVTYYGQYTDQWEVLSTCTAAVSAYSFTYSPPPSPPTIVLSLNTSIPYQIDIEVSNLVAGNALFLYEDASCQTLIHTETSSGTSYASQFIANQGSRDYQYSAKTTSTNEVPSTCAPSNIIAYTQSYQGVLRPSLALGEAYSCAIKSDRTIACWGSGNVGRMGNGSIDNQDYPVAVTGINNAVQVASKQDTGCALLENGEVKCWGAGLYGSLGDNNAGFHHATSPTSVQNLNNVVQIGIGKDHGCALLANGQLRCWGRGTNYRLGRGNNINNAKTPVAVHAAQNVTTPLEGVTQVVAGDSSTCALLSDQIVKCWGEDDDGRLGSGSHTGDVNYPVSVVKDATDSPVLDSVIAIAGGWHHFCALTSQNKAYCWGKNSSGELGLGNTSSKSKANLVKASSSDTQGLGGIVKLILGQKHTCALLSDQTVKCWGQQEHGRLGNGQTSASNIQYPVQVALGTANLSGVLDVAAGHEP